MTVCQFCSVFKIKIVLQGFAYASTKSATHKIFCESKLTICRFFFVFKVENFCEFCKASAKRPTHKIFCKSILTICRFFFVFKIVKFCEVRQPSAKKPTHKIFCKHNNLSRAFTNMNEDLSILSKWFISNKLTLNTSKYKYIIDLEVKIMIFLIFLLQFVPTIFLKPKKQNF